MRKNTSNTQKEDSNISATKSLLTQAGTTVRSCDMFGSITNFNIQGSKSYQTKLGALFTVGFWTMILTSVIYYIYKFDKKDDPLVGYNQYTADESPELDLLKENYHIYWIIHYKNTNQRVKWDEFWNSFSLYATYYIYGAEGLADNHGQQKWINIPFVKCSNQDWTNILDNGETKNDILNDGFCMNLSNLNVTLLKKSLNYYSKVNINLYKCQKSSNSSCSGTIKPSEILIQPHMVERSMRVKGYDPLDSWVYTISS